MKTRHSADRIQLACLEHEERTGSIAARPDWDKDAKNFETFRERLEDDAQLNEDTP